MKLGESVYGCLCSITVVFFVLCFSGRVIHGLKCYQCSWSSNPEDYLKEMESASPELQLAEPNRQSHQRENPKAKPYIGDKIRHVPSETEITNLCEEKECLSSDNTCLKWTYLSYTPINITYMCVSSRTTSGCFYQDVETKTGKQHLKIEACLCEDELCNGATGQYQDYKVPIVLTPVLITLINKLRS